MSHRCIFQGFGKISGKFLADEFKFAKYLSNFLLTTKRKLDTVSPKDIPISAGK